MSRVVMIIQARMGSSRLPGKVMKLISGKPMLWHVVNRAKGCAEVGTVVVATTTNEEDRAVKDLAEKNGVGTFCGSEDDVLDRYYQAAKAYRADVIVRITADCPLIDPQLIDRMVRHYIDNSDKYDYVGMARPSRYPNGLDTEVFSFAALERAWREARLKSEREHVTPYIWKNEHLFRIGAVGMDRDCSSYRWSVDEERDLELVREIHKHLYEEGRFFTTEEVLELLSRMPELADINRGIPRDAGYQKSLEDDSLADGENDLDG
ncbi:MAG: glycosyltransferase family protein [Candidatus Thermoplasmatota archaeon]|nr:glycosyltransferase family protein [Candidatus Thermoplasmatota archaeon]